MNCSRARNAWRLTDALAPMLPGVRIGTLEGQAHEGMTTAPEQYADAVRGFPL